MPANTRAPQNSTTFEINSSNNVVRKLLGVDMKKMTRLCFLSARILVCAIFLIGLAGCPNPGTDMATGAIVGDSLKSSAETIAFSLDRATANADYMMEKNLRRLELMSDSLAQRLEEEMAGNREFVSLELAKAADRLSELVEQVEGGILEIQDFAVLDVQNIINEIPFKKDFYLIRRVEGYGVMHKPDVYSDSIHLTFAGLRR